MFKIVIAVVVICAGYGAVTAAAGKASVKAASASVEYGKNLDKRIEEATK